jgi:hypothetical protein
MTASLMISENMALTVRSQVERMTGIEPALSAWESTDSVRIVQLEQRCDPSVSTREMPRFPGANGTLMARHWTQRAVVTRWGGDRSPTVL